MKTVYQTEDGALFDGKEAAWEHEETLGACRNMQQRFVDAFMAYYMDTPNIPGVDPYRLCTDINYHLSEFLQQSNYQITKE
jgi:hypothetical protein